tara:strand:- start:29 stop:406 length:378 start_codon:yes stop_codon:yes gene_type:complete
MDTRRMMITNDINNRCKTAVAYKRRSRGTENLNANSIANMGSHNIYFDRFDRKVVRFEGTDKTIKLNMTGSTDILDVPVNKIKSTFKDERGTFIVVLGNVVPIPVRESLSEISNLINKKENNYGR